MKFLNCDLFRRSFTNKGLGFTFNNENVDKLIKEGFQSKVFFFNSKRRPSQMKSASSKYSLQVIVENNAEEVKRFQDTINDAQPTGTFKYEPTAISVSLHNPMEPADLRSGSFKIPLGQSTIVYITPRATKVDDDGKELTEYQRHCRLNEDTDQLDIFNVYTKSACMFECKMKEAMMRCGCVPWNYPHDNKESNKECVHQRNQFHLFKLN